jgi:hypothetical protein
LASFCMRFCRRQNTRLRCMHADAEVMCQSHVRSQVVKRRTRREFLRHGPSSVMPVVR